MQGFVRLEYPDIFLSYAWVNNSKMYGVKRGWVSAFRRNLEKKLNERMNGESYWLFFDGNIRKYESVASQLLPKVKESALFVAIHSEAYNERLWCQSELSEFLNTMTANGGDAGAIFVVAIEEASLGSLGDRVPYRFYANGRPYLDPYPSEVSRDPSYIPYFKTLNDLAKDISQALKKRRKEIVTAKRAENSRAFALSGNTKFLNELSKKSTSLEIHAFRAKRRSFANGLTPAVAHIASVQPKLLIIDAPLHADGDIWDARKVLEKLARSREVHLQGCEIIICTKSNIGIPRKFADVLQKFMLKHQIAGVRLISSVNQLMLPPPPTKYPQLVCLWEPGTDGYLPVS